MIMYCEKCKKLISQSICPICGNKNIRIPEERDICFLVEKDHIWSGMLEDVLKQNNIPVFVQSNIGAGMAIKAGALFERIRFYVPFLYLEAANTIVNELFSADEYAENKGSMCVGDIYNAFLVALKMNRHSVLVTSKTNIYYYNEEP